MGIYSTRDLTRREAINKILCELDQINEMSNEHLEDILFALIGERDLNNYSITGSDNDF